MCGVFWWSRLQAGFPIWLLLVIMSMTILGVSLTRLVRGKDNLKYMTCEAAIFQVILLIPIKVRPLVAGILKMEHIPSGGVTCAMTAAGSVACPW